MFVAKKEKRDTPEESALPYKEIKMFLNFFFLFPQTPWTPSWPCSWPTPSTSRTHGLHPSRTSRRKRTWWIKSPKYKHFPAYFYLYKYLFLRRLNPGSTSWTAPCFFQTIPVIWGIIFFFSLCANSCVVQFLISPDLQMMTRTSYDFRFAELYFANRKFNVIYVPYKVRYRPHFWRIFGFFLGNSLFQRIF